MSEHFPTKPLIEQHTQKFLDSVNSQEGSPIYELSPTEARSLISKSTRCRC